MNEQLPVTSPVIPPDSREFLTTLCTECYFQVNVGARGRPTFAATNSSLVLEKQQRERMKICSLSEPHWSRHLADLEDQPPEEKVF
ncbi:hypothetical protein TELCIR_15879, partial [Teladorsagia circumcincta]